MHSLEELNATRVVIAQRLSTVRAADRIYVLEDGRVVQSGTYDELIGRPGPLQAPGGAAAGLATCAGRLGPPRIRSKSSRAVLRTTRAR